MEGVCPQTRICLKQAYIENLKPILVLNKIDRLILEKRLAPLDAYIHIMQVLEQVNAAMGNIFASDILLKEVKSDQVWKLSDFYPFSSIRFVYVNVFFLERPRFSA